MVVNGSLSHFVLQRRARYKGLKTAYTLKKWRFLPFSSFCRFAMVCFVPYNCQCD